MHRGFEQNGEGGEHREFCIHSSEKKKFRLLSTIRVDLLRGKIHQLEVDGFPNRCESLRLSIGVP